MSPLQQQVFEIYVSLGVAERTLTNLHRTLGRMGIKLSLGTLKRWSADYKWEDRLDALDSEVQAQLVQRFASTLTVRAARDLDRANRSKEKIADEMDKVLAAGELDLKQLRLLWEEYEAETRFEHLVLGKHAPSAQITINTGISPQPKFSPEQDRIDTMKRLGLPIETPVEKDVTPKENVA